MTRLARRNPLRKRNSKRIKTLGELKRFPFLFSWNYVHFQFLGYNSKKSSTNTLIFKSKN